MATGAAYEVMEGRRGTLKDDFSREYTRVFYVPSTSSVEPPNNVMFALNIPRLWDSFPTDSAARVRDVTPRQLQPDLWEVQVEYSTKGIQNPDKLGGSGSPSDYSSEVPTARPPKRKWGTRTYRIGLDRAIDGSAIVNSADCPFDPPPEIDVSQLTLTITRNEPSFDHGLAMALMNKVNSASFYGALPKCALMHQITADEEYENGFFFWSVTYEIHFDVNDWRLKVLDAGYYIRSIFTANKKVTIKDVDGQPLTAPTLLNGDGLQLLDDEDPVYRIFEIYPTFDFGLLGLE